MKSLIFKTDSSSLSASLEDGSNPTSLTVGELLINNLAIQAVDNDDDWNSLDFLSFEDSSRKGKKMCNAILIIGYLNQSCQA